jgi:hypothetical protein
MECRDCRFRFDLQRICRAGYTSTGELNEIGVGIVIARDPPAPYGRSLAHPVLISDGWREANCRIGMQHARLR